MITEDYVSFETAKLLKEKGFDESTNCQYPVGGIYYGEVGEYDTTDISRNPENYIPAPTLQMAMKWLREVYGLFVRITEDITGNVFEWSVYQKNYGCRACTFVEDSYEQACESAIRYTLKKLI